MLEEIPHELEVEMLRAAFEQLKRVLPEYAPSPVEFRTHLSKALVLALAGERKLPRAVRKYATNFIARAAAGEFDREIAGLMNVQ
jgi:hypothetical protein